MVLHQFLKLGKIFRITQSLQGPSQKTIPVFRKTNIPIEIKTYTGCQRQNTAEYYSFALIDTVMYLRTQRGTAGHLKGLLKNYSATIHHPALLHRKGRGSYWHVALFLNLEQSIIPQTFDNIFLYNIDLYYCF